MPPSAISNPEAERGGSYDRTNVHAPLPAGFNLPHPHSDGRFALAQLATDVVLIYPAKDHQKKPPSGFVALATHTGDHVPPILTGSASAFARWQPPKRCPMMARMHRSQRDRLRSEPR